MAVNRKRESITIPSAGDLSSNQFRIVAEDSNGRVAVAGAGTLRPMGILLNKPAAIDRSAEVAIVGSEVKIEAGAALVPGDLIVAVAGGRGSALGAGGNTPSGTAWVIGQCTQGASGSAAIGGVQVAPQYYVHA